MSIKVVLYCHNFWLKICNFVHFRNVIIKNWKMKLTFWKLKKRLTPGALVEVPIKKLRNKKFVYRKKSNLMDFKNLILTVYKMRNSKIETPYLVTMVI